MKPSMKKALIEAFAAPGPCRKHDFLKKLPPPEVSHFSFVINQAAYIRKWVWLLSVFIFATALLAAFFMIPDRVGMISALVPFLALSAVTENARSQIYGMAELEMASRFSLKSVVLARMAIMGTCHLILLILLVLLSGSHGIFTLLRTGVYFIVPYLLTTVLCLWIVLKIRGKESAYACMGAAIIVSGMNIIISNIAPILYSDAYFIKWTGLLVILFVLTLWEHYKTIRLTEEMKWSLS